MCFRSRASATSPPPSTASLTSCRTSRVSTPPRPSPSPTPAALSRECAGTRQVRARVPLSRCSDARHSDAHAAAVTRSHALSQAQPANTEMDAFIHPQAANLPLGESGADK